MGFGTKVQECEISDDGLGTQDQWRMEEQDGTEMGARLVGTERFVLKLILDASLSILVWFSPLQVVMVYLSSQPHLRMLLLVGYVTSAFLYLLVDAFQQKMIDHQILSGELLKESSRIDKKIQYSVVCTPKK